MSILFLIISSSSSRLQTLLSKFPTTHPGGRFVSTVVDSVLIGEKVDEIVAGNEDVVVGNVVVDVVGKGVVEVVSIKKFQSVIKHIKITQKISKSGHSKIRELQKTYQT